MCTKNMFGFVGLKTAMTREKIKFNGDLMFETGIPVVPKLIANATFMHEMDDFQFGVRLNMSTLGIPGIQAIGGICPLLSNYNPGFPASVAPNFNFVWSPEHQPSVRSTTFTAGISPVPGVKVFGSLPLDDVLHTRLWTWSAGVYYGLLPFTSLVLAFNDRRELGLGGRVQLMNSKLALTASIIVETQGPGSFEPDKHRLALGFEIG